MELVDLTTNAIAAIIVPSDRWHSYRWQRFGNQQCQGVCSLLSEAKAEAELGMQQESKVACLDG